MVEHERIVARRTELGISQAELARRVGVSQPMIVEIEKGRVQRTRFVIEIARALNLEPRDVDPLWDTEGAGQIISLEQLSDLPVLNLVTRGGRSEILPTPINYVARPGFLQHFRGAYAVLLNTEDMTPEFEPGDTLFVNPHLPPLDGYSYVFRATEGPGPAVVRRLLLRSEGVWKVKLWHQREGEDVYALPISEWPNCHRIVGKISRG